MKKPAMQKLTSLALVLVMLLTLFPAIYAGDGAAAPCETHAFENGVCSICGAQEPTETQEPAEAQEPTETQEPTEAQEPTEMQEPAETQEPTDETAESGPADPELMAVIAPPVQTHTFIFYAGGEEFHRVILKDDETLVRPDNPPVQSGYRFSGWYTSEACTEEFTGFGQTAAMDDGTTKLYAKIEKVFYIRYLNPDGEIIRTDEVAENGSYTFRADDPAFSTALDKVNVGWIEEGGESVEHAGDTIAVTADMTLRPHLQPGFTARFLTQGGSFVASQYVLSGDTVQRPATDPTRTGYDFKGWYTTADGSTQYQFGVELNANADIYAQWTPVQVDYSVVFWVEDANSDEYVLTQTERRSANTGDTVSYTASDASKYGNTYFRIDTDRSVPVEVKADGSTTLQIYFERLKYDFLFQVGSNQYTFSGIKHQQMVDSVYYGIPDFQTQGKTGYPYFVDVDPTRYLTLLPGTSMEHPSLANYGFSGALFGETVKINLVMKNDGAHKVFWYAEYAEGLWPEGTETVPGPDGKEYVLIRYVAWESSCRERCYAMEGFTPKYIYFTNGSMQEISSSVQDFVISGNNNRFYSWVNHWDISFEPNGGTAVDPVTNIMWSSPISDFKPASYSEGQTEKEQDGVKYRFSGWYWDSTFLQQVDWAHDTMPDYSAILYAKWEPLTSTVTFDANGGELSSDGTVTLATGQTVAKPTDPTHSGEGWSFLGWTLGGKIYDFSSPVTGDITLVAQWANSTLYTVAYNHGAGSGSVSDGDREYLAGATAVAASGAALTPPSGQHFVCWQDKNGGTYLPGGLLNIADALAENGVITLTAIYEPDETPASLVYDLNYSHYGKSSPCGYEEDASSEPDGLNNRKITLRAPTSEEMLQGYSFGGWYLNEDCTGDAVTEVLIDHNDPTPNAIYAKWTANTDTAYKVEFYYEADGQYPTTADESENRTGTTDTEASVTDDDKTPTREKYVLDERHTDAFSGTIAGDGSLVLKVFFRQQFTITYDPNGGTINGSTASVEELHYYGDEITIIAAPVRKNYTFLYWKGSRYQPGDLYTVTEDHSFVAQWKWKDPNIPVTGDETNLPLWTGTLILATLGFAAAAFGLTAPRKKKGRHSA